MPNTPNPHQEPHHLPSPDGFMDPQHAASMLCISVLTLADWRVKGIGPKFIKVGRLVRYRRSDVLAWLDSRTVQSTAQADEMGA